MVNMCVCACVRARVCVRACALHAYGDQATGWMIWCLNPGRSKLEGSPSLLFHGYQSFLR